MDRVWRARTARRVLPILRRRDAGVLDLCCGTGDLAFALAGSGPATVIGADFSHAMLVRANAKNKGDVREPKTETAAPAGFFEADALRLPFADASFDLVTAAFCFSNLGHFFGGVCEKRGGLRAGGPLAVLGFDLPPPGFVGGFD